MGTFESVDEVESAYEDLLNRQRKLAELIDSDEVDWEKFQGIISEQTELIEAIENSVDADQNFQERRPERYQTIVDEVQSLREDLIDEVKKRRDEVENQLESLDQSMSLLDEYQQDTGSSYHLDRTI